MGSQTPLTLSTSAVVVNPLLAGIGSGYPMPPRRLGNPHFPLLDNPGDSVSAAGVVGTNSQLLQDTLASVLRYFDGDGVDAVVAVPTEVPRDVSWLGVADGVGGPDHKDVAPRLVYAPRALPLSPCRRREGPTRLTSCQSRPPFVLASTLTTSPSPDQATPRTVYWPTRTTSPCRGRVMRDLIRRVDSGAHESCCPSPSLIRM